MKPLATEVGQLNALIRSTTHNIATPPIAYGVAYDIHRCSGYGKRDEHSSRSEDGRYKDQLSNFHTDIEHQQRDRNRLLWETHFGESAGEAKAMQEAETESDHPRCAGCESRFAAQPGERSRLRQTRYSARSSLRSVVRAPCTQPRVAAGEV